MTGTAALIVAAGRGRRAGGGLAKQYRPLGGRPVLLHAAGAFAAHPGIDRLLIMIHPDDAALFAETVAPHLPAHEICHGGASRAESVRAGLEALAGRGVSRVLIHDGARPLVPAAVIDRVLEALDSHAGAAPGVELADSLWRVEGGQATAIVPRQGLWRAQTPQGFRLDAIRAAHAAWPAEAPEPTDDVAVALRAGLDVAVVAGEEENLKITRPADFARAARLLEARLPEQEQPPMDIRTGQGFDVHAFTPGDHVILCGVRIPHERALKGHSDADVAMHAVTDAIYGALGAGDIGRHFPPSEARWKGAPSHLFLAHAAKLARKRGFSIAHLDCTIICEAPRIGPHAPAMCRELARIAGIGAGRVSVKATTSEGLGFTGRGEGIAALAIATLIGGGGEGGMPATPTGPSDPDDGAPR